MSKNIYLVLGAVLILVLVGVLALRKDSTPLPSPAPSVLTTPAPTPAAPRTPQATPSSTPKPTPSPSPSPAPQSPTITYSGNDFSPEMLHVKVGTTVIFKNQSSGEMWIASNPHPIHADYPGFDAHRSYTNGESYSFTFTKPGTWRYHNHVDASRGGTIMVE